MDPTPATATSTRLRALAAACAEGDVAGVELELYGWRREPDCPPTARALLGALLARRGELAAARDALHEAVAGLPAEADSEVLQLLIATLVIDDCTDAAEGLARMLRRRPGDVEAGRWVEMMALGDRGEEEAATPDGEAGHLAMELCDQPHAIATLVYAQKHEPHPAAVSLLRSALVIAEPMLQLTDWHAGACLALAELAVLAADEADARRWARRGLVIDPYSAALAMVLDRVSDAPELAPLAVRTLDAVAARHPSYPDIRAALIRREFASGRREAAHRRLARWLDDEPGSPLALDLKRELAA
jgi:tetratricopeptide (TPR) repeat protein